MTSPNDMEDQNLPKQDMLALLDGDFRSNSHDRIRQERLARQLAQAIGWVSNGYFFVHQASGRRYRMSDMDGWTDLCGMEGIIP